MRRRRWVMAAALAAVIIGTGMLAALMTVGARAAMTKLCNSQAAPVSGGSYRIQNNEWDSTASECITTEGNASFTVANSSISKSSGAPGGYPSIYKGCQWGACTTGSGLPIRVSSLTPGIATTSWSTTQTGSGSYDVAYDIWFNRTPTTSGQPNGAELMVWLTTTAASGSRSAPRSARQPSAGTPMTSGLGTRAGTGSPTRWPVGQHRSPAWTSANSRPTRSAAATSRIPGT